MEHTSAAMLSRLTAEGEKKKKQNPGIREFWTHAGTYRYKKPAHQLNVAL